MDIGANTSMNTTMFVTGCSFTSGWPLETKLGHRNFAWPRLVADHFGYNLIDKSRSSSSNYRIYRKAVEGILDDDVDFVIAFLSPWTRLETGGNYGEKPGRIYQHLPGHDIEVFKKFFNGYKNYTDCLRIIISLQNLSKQYAKPLYLLDSFQNNIHRNITRSQFVKILQFNDIVYDNMHDEYVDHKFKKVQNLERHINWNMFMHHKSYQELVAKTKLIDNHPAEDGHKKISEIVINYLEKNYE
jgi:hypothetical protein